MTDLEYVQAEEVLSDMELELEDAISEYDSKEEQQCRLEDFIIKLRKEIEELKGTLND